MEVLQLILDASEHARECGQICRALELQHASLAPGATSSEVSNSLVDVGLHHRLAAADLIGKASAALHQATRRQQHVPPTYRYTSTDASYDHNQSTSTEGGGYEEEEEADDEDRPAERMQSSSMALTAAAFDALSTIAEELTFHLHALTAIQRWTKAGAAGTIAPPTLAHTPASAARLMPVGASTTATATATSASTHHGPMSPLAGTDPHLLELIEQEIIDHTPTVGFDDIAGLAFAKQVIRELVGYPLQRPDLFPLANLGSTGILLFGR
jgi:hypothetical protein